MAKTSNKQSRPAWQQNPVFEFFSSVKLAMLLLSVLIVAIIAGTLYESSFDAKVARAYVYGAPWFNIWLLLLGINLLCSAFSRMPWKKHHTGFLITHLGIIILLIGSYIGRTWGVEGTMTLFKGDPPNNLLLVDQRVLQVVEDENKGRAIPLELLSRKPSREHPLNLPATSSGWQLSVVGYAPLLALNLEPKSLAKGGVPALHISLATAMMNQTLESWLLADDPRHSTFDLGLASITFKKGAAALVNRTVAPKDASSPVEIEETIFAFANVPDQVGKALKGGSTGAKIKLVDVGKETDGTVIVEVNGRSQSFEVKSSLGRELPLNNSPYKVTIDRYWPDFRIKDGIPGSLSDEPSNPCVLVTLRGQGVPVTTESALPPSMHESQGRNHLTIYLDENGRLTYELASRKAGATTGALEPGQPLPTGWADWKLTADKLLPHAEEHFTATPLAAGAAGQGTQTEGVRIRAARGGESREEWVPLGWQISLPVTSKPLRLSYGYLQQPLPIGIRLLDFEVQRNEGTDTPAGFKSTVEITNIEGQTATGQCWMNNPISYPDHWLNTFSGLTYKISQASWNPENLSQSTVQILRDPGWSLKWIGSLLVVLGIFSLFYLRPYPDDLLSPTDNPAQKSRPNTKPPVSTPVGV